MKVRVMVAEIINWNAASAGMALLAATLLLGGCSAVPGVKSSSLTPVQVMTRKDAARLVLDAEKSLAAGRLVDGGAAYVHIVTVFPDDARAWFRLGTIYLRTGQYGAAQMACERALRLEPGMSKAHANLALAHLHQFRAAALPAIASPDISKDNHRALAALLRDVDHAIAPAGASQ